MAASPPHTRSGPRAANHTPRSWPCAGSASHRAIRSPNTRHTAVGSSPEVHTAVTTRNGRVDRSDTSSLREPQMMAPHPTTPTGFHVDEDLTADETAEFVEVFPTAQFISR